MELKKMEEEYEYLEQMLAVYKQKQKKIQKKFNKMESFGEINRMVEFLRVFIPANLIIFLVDHKYMLGLEAAKLAQSEVQFFLLSYLSCKFADKSLGVDHAGKRLERIDLEQLAIDLYNYQEKEKGCYAQMRQCSRRFLNEEHTEKAKVYAKR